MPTLTVANDHHDQLQAIADMVCHSNQILVVTGAGISTNTGIPDFRSANGLYNLVKSRYPNYSALVKGRDLFDSILFTDPTLTSIFFSFLSELRQKVENIDNTTATHKFIKNLADTERLLRCYTQNIDGLESRDGLCMDVTKGIGKRGKGRERVGKEQGCEVVQLHGDLEQLRCSLCGLLAEYTAERLEILASGEPPDCPECSTKANDRVTAGKRSIAVGTLRPNIVLYNEPHPKGELIGKLTHHDATRANPDLMVIIGTSLKVIGLKRIVKAFANKIHERGGKVVFVNNMPASESVWGGVIDYHVQMDCDDWVSDLKARRAEIWEKARRKLGRRKTMGAQLGSGDSDKENNTDKKEPKRRKSMPATAAAARRSKSDLGSVLLTPKKSPLRTVSAPSTSKRSLEQVDPFMTPSKRQKLNAPSSANSIIRIKGNISIYEDSRKINSSPFSAFTEPPSELLTPTPRKNMQASASTSTHSAQVGYGNTPRRFLQCVSVPTTPRHRKDSASETPSKKNNSTLSSEEEDEILEIIDDELAIICTPSKNRSPNKQTAAAMGSQVLAERSSNSPSKPNHLLATPSRRLAMGFPQKGSPYNQNFSPSKTPKYNPPFTPSRRSVHNTPSSGNRDARGFKIRSGQSTASRNRIVRSSVSPAPPCVFAPAPRTLTNLSNEDTQLPTPPTSQHSPNKKPLRNFEVQIPSPRKRITPPTSDPSSATSSSSSSTFSMSLDQRQLQQEMKQSVELPPPTKRPASIIRQTPEPIKPVNFYAPASTGPNSLNRKRNRKSMLEMLPPLSVKTRNIAKVEKKQEEWNKPGVKTRARRKTLEL